MNGVERTDFDDVHGNVKNDQQMAHIRDMLLVADERQLNRLFDDIGTMITNGVLNSKDLRSVTVQLQCCGMIGLLAIYGYNAIVRAEFEQEKADAVDA
jgi:hypothetical protein